MSTSPGASISGASIKVLAVASGGGHWEQLMLLRPALANFDVVYATTNGALASRDGLAGVLGLPDTNRNRPFRSIRACWEAHRLVRRVRPDFVITTGALPGLFVLIAGWAFGAKTIWVDSAANSEKPSMSGEWARHFATLWLTQWEHLATSADRIYAGTLL